MKKSQRKNLGILIAGVVIFGLGYAAASFGAPSHGVKYTAHNFGSTGTVTGFKFSAGETEICVFCHTPHNAAAGKKFLWNKTNKVTTFQYYTASDTLNYNRSGIELSDVSKMCMTCHDGAGGINSMANPRPQDPLLPDGGNAGDQIGDIWDGPDGPISGKWGPNIGNAFIADSATDLSPVDGYSDYVGGGNLTNDHPVSFPYNDTLVNEDGTLNASTDGYKTVGGLPLWNGKVECVTCHDPHINYNAAKGGDAGYTPFLRKKNFSSSLCFTCHNK